MDNIVNFTFNDFGFVNEQKDGCVVFADNSCCFRFNSQEEGVADKLFVICRDDIREIRDAMTKWLGE